MQTLTDFENVVSMGHKLLIENYGIDYPQNPIQTSRAPHGPQLG